MSAPAFVSCPLGIPSSLRRPTGHALRPRGVTQRHPLKSRCTKMQLPPSTHIEPPLTPEQKGPPEYKWNPDYPGTLKPGTVEDNYPLDEVLASGVYERMQYEELDIDDRTPYIFEPEEDLLHWLAGKGRLIPRGMSDEEFYTEAERQISGITEEDLEFADEDSKMIAYYSKQGDGSGDGASMDFGGFSDSNADFEQEF